MHERLPTAVQITTTRVTCSHRNLPSYISGPETQIKVLRLLPEALGEDPPTPRQLLGVQGLLQLRSRPPSLRCVVPQPLSSVSSPVSLTRAVAVGSGGAQGFRTTSARDLQPLTSQQGPLFSNAITFQGSSAQDVHPSLGAPSQPTVTGEQSRAGKSSDARRATGPMGGSNQIASLDEKPGAVEGRGLQAVSQDGADRQGRGR